LLVSFRTTSLGFLQWREAGEVLSLISAVSAASLEPLRKELAFLFQTVRWVLDQYKFTKFFRLFQIEMGASAPSLSIPTPWRLGNWARQVNQVSDGLLYMSESDYPFELFLWENRGKQKLIIQDLRKHQSFCEKSWLCH
jgi:hypothetical protein